MLHTINILSIDSAGEAIPGIVVYRNGLIERTDFDDGERGAKNLLLRKAHIWTHVCKERRTIEVSPCQFPFTGDRSTRHKGCPLSFADLSIAVYLLKLGSINDRANIYGLIEAIAQAQLFDTRYQFL